MLSAVPRPLAPSQLEASLMRIPRLLPLLILFFPALGEARGLAITKPDYNTQTPGCYQKFELSFQVEGAAFDNPYDPDQIDCRVIFSPPNGPKIKVLCFPYQGFVPSGGPHSETLSAQGPLLWKCRFSPDSPGPWTYEIVARQRDQTAHFSSNFRVKKSKGQGFIRLSSKDPHYFSYDNGDSYFPIGENVAWPSENGIVDYDRWIPGLAAQGGNFARIWMATWSFGVEWNDTGLGDYTKRQDRAWKLDKVMELCERQGVKVMLTLISHGAFSSTTDSNWKDSPFNRACWSCSQAPWGILDSPDKLWTDEDALAYIDRRLRYVVARWGYSSSLFAWELWNEMEWTDHYADHVAASASWHAQNATFLRAYDVQRHLVTTSYANYPGHREVFDSGMDISQVHSYGSRDLAETTHSITRGMLKQVPGKPFLLGEFGGEAAENDKAVSADPTGIGIHNVIWASLMSGAGGSGFVWDWKGYVDPQNLYPRFKGLSKFLAKERLDARSYRPIEPIASTSVLCDLSLSPGLDGWGVKTAAADFKVLPDGGIQPGLENLCAFQYDPEKPEFRNPPTFEVDYSAAGTFRVGVSQAGPGGAEISVSVDRQPALTRKLRAGKQTTEITVPLAAGKHFVRIDSTGVDWYRISSVFLSGYSGVLRSYALAGQGRILGWIQSRNHSEGSVRAGLQQPTVRDGVLHLEGIDAAPGSAWRVTWWDTETGLPRSGLGGIVHASHGKLDLAVPALDAINPDIAFKLESSD